MMARLIAQLADVHLKRATARAPKLTETVTP